MLITSIPPAALLALLNPALIRLCIVNDCHVTRNAKPDVLKEFLTLCLKEYRNGSNFFQLNVNSTAIAQKDKANHAAVECLQGGNIVSNTGSWRYGSDELLVFREERGREGKLWADPLLVLSYGAPREGTSPESKRLFIVASISMTLASPVKPDTRGAGGTSDMLDTAGHNPGTPESTMAVARFISNGYNQTIFLAQMQIQL
ncbi:hypothetical protein RRG08_029222 [Elysia crispata]|uniref:Uncharacterized protein n=1 Tax=Elysia crispata TaxID=231223 RepID=A0AAE1E0W1_9GAST|nr:hypothetical protein RRG08_029222 [Elysia crispata]